MKSRRFKALYLTLSSSQQRQLRGEGNELPSLNDMHETLAEGSQ